MDASSSNRQNLLYQPEQASESISHPCILIIAISHQIRPQSQRMVAPISRLQSSIPVDSQHRSQGPSTFSELPQHRGMTRDARAETRERLETCKETYQVMSAQRQEREFTDAVAHGPPGVRTRFWKSSMVPCREKRDQVGRSTAQEPASGDQPSTLARAHRRRRVGTRPDLQIARVTLEALVRDIGGQVWRDMPHFVMLATARVMRHQSEVRSVASHRSLGTPSIQS